jgi:hypothetical protein
MVGRVNHEKTSRRRLGALADRRPAPGLRSTTAGMQKVPPQIGAIRPGPTSDRTVDTPDRGRRLVDAVALHASHEDSCARSELFAHVGGCAAPSRPTNGPCTWTRRRGALVRSGSRAPEPRRERPWIPTRDTLPDTRKKSLGAIIVCEASEGAIWPHIVAIASAGVKSLARPPGPQAPSLPPPGSLSQLVLDSASGSCPGHGPTGGTVRHGAQGLGPTQGFLTNGRTCSSMSRCGARPWSSA